MNNLINSGTIPQVKKAIKTCNSRTKMRLALRNEQENRKRKTVINLLEEAIKA